MRALRTALLAAGILVWAAPAAAQGGRPEPACEFAHVSPMNFGSYDPMSDAPLDSLGQISYRCFRERLLSTDAGGKTAPDNPPISVEISISEGLSSSFYRSMMGTHDDLEYNLYLDPLHLIIWGDGRAGTRNYTASALPNNQVTTVPVFGRVPRGQDVHAGPYFDQVVVTLNF